MTATTTAATVAARPPSSSPSPQEEPPALPLKPIEFRASVLSGLQQGPPGAAQSRIALTFLAERRSARVVRERPESASAEALVIGIETKRFALIR
jgi:hypothetical protein